ncbi:autotransporter outer membrane beta-barrel domain-containing protein (plasmid) [Rhizobium beringeri]|uniref:autotransporter family protein n=1 Tax=Rhizobium TaxID=379 RepID=UPI001031D0CD|nr:MULTISPECIES: autotransporter outer membrane beta-barrel domain-containing protein [Rhizobium]TBC88618.1 autotransporter outer membrane beta-barrel domain-containing protein [Rhizobium leguminosarum]WSG77790.1 autotransporter outer membrane beta-barrel domain-containing protein [Rhizobium beringeri]WSG92949.1 autotransporter outer membrane beta-barrel domain-containing protein [Rhizobium beringeri]WSH17985.1 autotransporter outer membrane beta-barrel domain-containing protein [Rhizobium beri
MVVSAGSINVGQVAGVPGALTIQNGSRLTNTSNARLAVVAGSSGTVTVTGPGSQWNIPAFTFYVGFQGTGTLSIENGGQVTTGSNTILGGGAASSGTLNIGSGGTLQTLSLRGGPGASQANFDNGILHATAANATFINGFSGTELNLLAGGLTIDTAGFAVGTDATSGFSGVGGLTVTGGGVFSLLANSIYTGETQIDFGSSLALSGAGAIANSSRVVADGIFNVSAATTPTIQSLAGSGSVLLGAQTLTIANANDTFAGVIGGTGGLTVTGGNQTLSGVNTYTGATTVTGGRLAVNGSITSPVTTSGTGILGGTGTIFGDVSNAGVVAPGNSIGTLTVTGSYTGTGGTLEIETVLGGDASPSDRLVVTGNTAGTTDVTVVNLGGGGAQTVEGIKIIDVGGISAGNFSLLGDYVFEGDQAVVAGAYAYRLYQGGVSTPADGDWYLRSTELDAAGVAIGPIYAPGVPVYEAYAGVLQSLNQFGTLRQRTGGWMLVGDRSADQDGNAAATGIQTRIGGSRSHFEPESSTTGTDYEVSSWTLQAGVDGVLRESEAGTLIGGINFHMNTASADISSRFGKGDIDTTGYGFDGTLTWYGKSGFYVDTQAAVTWYDSDLKSSTLQTSLGDGNDGFGYGLSVEAGQTIALTSQWSLTPQAQLAYSSVRFDSFTDAYGADVSLDDGDSLTGRLGISADFDSDWKDASGKTSRSTLYGIANLYYDFLDGSNVHVSGTSVVNENQALWGGLGLGGSLSWSDERYAAHGEAFASTSLKDFGDSNTIGAKIGFSVKW